MLLRTIISLKSEGGVELENIFGAKSFFSNPKPSALIKLLIGSVDAPDSLVLDFFSGSATTAHALLQLNAEDGGHRRFIMIQLPEECSSGSEARKAGFANICEIGEERIRRAGNQILRQELEKLEKEGIVEKSTLDAEIDAAAGIVLKPALDVLRRFGYKVCDELIADAQSPEAASKLSSLASKLSIDTSFRVFKVDSSNMKDVYYTAEETEQDRLDELVDNIKEDRTAEDLLFQAMLELGIELSADIAEEEIAGHRVFFVREGALAACFDANIKEETLTEIAKRKPAFAVFRDSGMADDSAHVNFEQIFKGYSPQTRRRVI